MKLEIAKMPPTPRSLPVGLELVDYRGEEDFDMLYTVLEAAFQYEGNRLDNYEKLKQIFGSFESAYIPICIEKSSQQPIATIAALEMETKKGKQGSIATFGVIPLFQGRGIGSLLMERAIDYYWHSGVKNVELSARVENPRALGVYERFGFQAVSTRTTIVLAKHL